MKWRRCKRWTVKSHGQTKDDKFKPIFSPVYIEKSCSYFYCAFVPPYLNTHDRLWDENLGHFLKISLATEDGQYHSCFSFKSVNKIVFLLFFKDRPPKDTDDGSSFVNKRQQSIKSLILPSSVGRGSTLNKNRGCNRPPHLVVAFCRWMYFSYLNNKSPLVPVINKIWPVDTLLKGLS